MNSIKFTTFLILIFSMIGCETMDIENSYSPNTKEISNEYDKNEYGYEEISLKMKLIPGYLSDYGTVYFNIDKHIKAKIGSNIKISHPSGIVLGPSAIIGDNVIISQGVTVGGSFNKSKNQLVGESTFLGAGAKILGNVEIGSNCIIGANAVITKNVKSDKIVVGYNKVIEKSPKDYLT